MKAHLLPMVWRCAVLVGIWFTLETRAQDSQPGVLPLSVLLETQQAVERGAFYLADRQLSNGSWANTPTITSLAALALMNAPGNVPEKQRERVDKALNYIRRQHQVGGGIWSRSTQQYPLYSTAVSLFALVRAQRPRDAEIIREAREYLLGCQVNEGSTSIPEYGGFRTGPGERPSLTVSHWVLEALYVSDYLGKPPPSEKPARRAQSLQAYKRAQAFIERCQQLRSENEVGTGGGSQPGDVGYFRDFPMVDAPSFADDVDKVPGTPRSRAFLTCAGVKSLIYAKKPLSDARVLIAFDWLKTHYSVRENPSLGQVGFYTYLFTLVRTLRALDLSVVRTETGTRAWRLEVTYELLSRQGGNGSWQNNHFEWWENRPELVTAYSMLMLEIACNP
ncbi:MAG: terpene cyclase/mutase family protein [Candidatus Pacebacteria bacterium]|nr:terpene cyclase/mutase family protein [Candidatus Paceibacterota bacterium]